MGGPTADIRIREATPDDRLDVRRILDAAMLRVRDDLGERVAAGDVLVAEENGTESDAGSDSPVLGAVVLVPREDRGARVDAVAVRRARRGQGVGSALLGAAAERREVLTAEFDPDVRPFYESLGFDISRIEGDGSRRRGRFDGPGDADASQ